MKKKITIIIVFFCFFLCGFRYDLPEEILDNNDFSGTLSDETLQILDEIGISELSAEGLQEVSFSNILKHIKDSLIRKWKAPFRAVLSFFGNRNFMYDFTMPGR